MHLNAIGRVFEISFFQGDKCVGKGRGKWCAFRVLGLGLRRVARVADAQSARARARARVMARFQCASAARACAEPPCSGGGKAGQERLRRLAAQGHGSQQSCCSQPPPSSTPSPTAAANHHRRQCSCWAVFGFWAPLKSCGTHAAPCKSCLAPDVGTYSQKSSYQ
jgi:hypothetical protein